MFYFLTYRKRKCSRKLLTPNHWFRKDKTLYKQNGILHMLDRNRMIKVWNLRWAVKRDVRKLEPVLEQTNSLAGVLCMRANPKFLE
jgi:hypothetical protein